MKTCVFVMVGDDARGTGFLIGVKEPDTRYFCYFVTAKHVIQPALQNAQSLRLRLNKRESEDAEVVEFPIISIDGKPWIEDSNPAIDLAITPLAIWDKAKQYDVNMFTVDSATNDYFATQSFIERYKIGPGDHAFTLGLLPLRHDLFNERSKCKNIIMTRSGTISMIGTKDLPLRGGIQKAHFLDCHAFGGQSGSPAFVLLERDEKGSTLLGGWKIALLGVVTEFVPSDLRFRPFKENEVVDKAEQETQNLVVPIENTGISKVVPVDYLVGLLFSPDQQKFRKAVSEQEQPPAQ